MCSTLHAMVNFHHKVKFCNLAFEFKNTPCALACHQKRLIGWKEYAQTCLWLNFPKHNTDIIQVACFFRWKIIFNMYNSLATGMSMKEIFKAVSAHDIHEIHSIYIVASRGYIIYSDRRSGSSVSTAYTISELPPLSTLRSWPKWGQHFKSAAFRGSETKLFSTLSDCSQQLSPTSALETCIRTRWNYFRVVLSRRIQSTWQSPRWLQRIPNHHEILI